MWEDLAKLSLLLSSDQSGEVNAAATAIGKKLKANGKDWHDFAAKIRGTATAQDTAKRPPPRSTVEMPTGKGKWRGDDGFEFIADFLHETDKAVLFADDAGDQFWVPLSQMGVVEQEGLRLRVEVSGWFARKREWL